MHTISIQVQDFTQITKDNLRLKGKAWLPVNPKCVVCLVHGLGDHMMRYVHVAQYLAEQQIAFVTYDQRGHGSSEGKRGHTASYEALLDDIEVVLKKTQTLYPGVPLFLYGHSMGGNEVANYVLRRTTTMLAGVIISSPWFKLGFNPSSIKVMLGTMMSKIYPGFVQPNQINAHQLTRDPAIAKAYIEDPLVHHDISAGMFVSMYQAGEWALSHAAQLSIPALVMHGSDDPITSVAATREFVKNAGEKATLQIWNGLLHETHNEAEKAQVLALIKDWLFTQIRQKNN